MTTQNTLCTNLNLFNLLLTAFSCNTLLSLAEIGSPCRLSALVRSWCPALLGCVGWRARRSRKTVEPVALLSGWMSDSVGCEWSDVDACSVIDDTDDSWRSCGTRRPGGERVWCWCWW